MFVSGVELGFWPGDCGFLEFAGTESGEVTITTTTKF